MSENKYKNQNPKFLLVGLFTPTRVEFLFQVVLGIGALFQTDTLSINVPVVLKVTHDCSILAIIISLLRLNLEQSMLRWKLKF